MAVFCTYFVLYYVLLFLSVPASPKEGQRRLSTQKGGEAGVPLCPLGPAWARIRGCRKLSAAEHDDDDDGPCCGQHPNINTKSAGVGGRLRTYHGHQPQQQLEI